MLSNAWVWDPGSEIRNPEKPIPDPGSRGQKVTGSRIRNTATMERFDQGHLHPKLEVPGLTCPGRESNPGLPDGRRAL
jgi:hypothetical protein